MSLDAIRDKSRAQVHGAFSIPADVFSADGKTRLATQVPVRLHLEARKPFGDLDREGFALVIEMHNEAIFDTQAFRAQKRHLVDFGRERVFRVDSILSPKHERYQKVQLVYEKE